MRDNTLGPFVPQPLLHHLPSSQSIVTIRIYTACGLSDQLWSWCPFGLKVMVSKHNFNINVLFFTSLGAILVAAFIAIFIRSWIHELNRGLEAVSGSKQRALVREYRNQDLLFWKLPQIIALLPILIYISLLLFSSGLVIFLFHIHKLFDVITLAVFLCGASFYGVTMIIATLDSSAPFHSPISRALGLAYRHAYAFLPCENSHRTIPTSFSNCYSLQRLVNLVRTVLWWRPYSEVFYPAHTVNDSWFTVLATLRSSS